MPIVVAPPAYQDPNIGQIASNLATAIYGNPDMAARNAYYGAEADNARASAKKTDAETQGVNIKNNALTQLGNLPRQLARQSGETQSQYMARVTPQLSPLLQIGTGADDAAKGLNTALATLYTTSPDDSDRIVGSLLDHKMVTKDDAFSTQGQADIAQRDAANADKQATDVAKIDQAGALSRVFAQPVEQKPGVQVILAPNDPRANTVGPDGNPIGHVIQGAPTVDSVRGRALQDIYNLPAGAPIPENLAVAGSGKDQTVTARPRTVNEKSLHQVAASALASIPGIQADNDPKGVKTAANASALMATLDPAKVQAAQTAAANELATTGRADVAQQKYLAALGVQTGDSFQQPSLIGRVFGHPSGLVHAPNSATAAAPAPAPQTDNSGLATFTDASQLPPPATRQDGMTINSPKGPVTWNAKTQTWLPAQPGA